jgi:hypothetical protein
MEFKKNEIYRFEFTHIPEKNRIHCLGITGIDNLQLNIIELSGRHNPKLNKNISTFRNLYNHQLNTFNFPSGSATILQFHFL